jgi:flagellar basal-body rod protein FlgB
MTKIFSDLFNLSDRVQMESLSQRLKRSQLIDANIANAETPGFRALGYDFEDHLQALTDRTEGSSMRATQDKHFRLPGVPNNGKVESDVYIRPTESVGHDGNTVDIDVEMAQLAGNQILYRATVEAINRKIATLRYAINGGR